MLNGKLIICYCYCLLLASSKSQIKSFEVVPIYDDQLRNEYLTYAQHLSQKEHYAQCGIIWTLLAINGSSTDFKRLSVESNGEGSHRMMAVVYEVLRSAARVKHALQIHDNVPSQCLNTSVEITLYADRGILSLQRDLLGEVSCIFDRILYLDDLPLGNLSGLHAIIHSSRTTDKVQRLPPRINTMKLIALLSSPYMNTLYLDGDTAPCEAFQYYSFDQLSNYDIFTTLNPFGYQSTAGKPLYPGAPSHPAYKNYVEPNGGVIGFRRNERTQRLLVRALELIPFFNSMGFDQDQAYLRHALFEETMLYGLRQNIQPMRKFCRFGWNCNLNTCAKGCAIIHQRWCVNYGVNASFEVDATSTRLAAGHHHQQQMVDVTCNDVAHNVEQKMAYFTRQYNKARKQNKEIPRGGKKRRGG